MNRCIGLAIAAAVMSVALTAPAVAGCLGSRLPITGTLAASPASRAAAGAMHNFQILLAAPVCADISGLNGEPVRIGAVQTVEIAVSSAAGAKRLEALLGRQITVAGYLDAPDPQRHSGDVVLANAWLVSAQVPAANADAAANTEPVPGDAGQMAASPDATANPDSAMPSDATADAAQPPQPAEMQPEPETAKADAAAPAEAQNPPPDTKRADTEAKLRRFVTEFYLSGKDVTPELLAGIYAPEVDYYGKPGTSIDYLVNSKVTFFNRWPTRVFTLRPGTLEIRTLPASPDIYELTFAYDFKWTAPGRTRSGIGYVRLKIDLAEGHGKIVSEGGKLVDAG